MIQEAKIINKELYDKNIFDNIEKKKKLFDFTSIKK